MYILMLITIVLALITLFLFMRAQRIKELNKKRLRILNNLKRANYVHFAGICDLGLTIKDCNDVCILSSGTIKEFNSLLVSACKELEVYSGNPIYPIKDVNGLMDSKLIFHTNIKNDSLNINNVTGMWDKSTIYGKSRLAVLKLLIHKYEKLLKD